MEGVSTTDFWFFGDLLSGLRPCNLPSFPRKRESSLFCIAFGDDEKLLVGG